MSLSLRIRFSYGWCILAMSTEGQSVEIRNHWLNDGFPELVDSVNLLLHGKQSVSCRWQLESSGGSFIDLVTDPESGLNIAVHELYYPDANTTAGVWSALRGNAVFTAHVPLKDFVVQFAGALRTVRTLAVDASGMIAHWRYPFPQAGFELIERKAKGYGYKPKSHDEIVAEQDQLAD